MLFEGKMWYTSSIKSLTRATSNSRVVRHRSKPVPTSNHTTEISSSHVHVDLYCIYRIVNFRDGKIYIGQTVDLKKRKSTHLKELKAGNHKNQQLQNAYNKYGKSAFYFEMVERDIPKDQINEREQYWITHFDSYRSGYNLTLGGNATNPYVYKSVTWNGDIYPSKKAAARALGITPAGVDKWLKKGYDCDNDVVVGYDKSPQLCTRMSGNSAIDEGRTCSFCVKPASTYHYSRSVNVRWLHIIPVCEECHQYLHDVA